MNYSSDTNKKRYKTHKSRGKRVKNKFGIIFFRVVVAVVVIGGLCAAGAVIGAYMAIIENSPTLTTVVTATESYDSIILDKNGSEFDRLDGGENREYADWDQIPQYLKDAAVAIEDERFYSHNGVDLKATVRSVVQTLMYDSTQGGSTITQQLIKNKLGYTRNSIETKLQEQYLAMNYETELTEQLGSKEAAKDYVLLQYLNIIALGHGQNGVQAASRYYFNKDVSELSLAECAVIIATTQNPVGYSPKNYPTENRIRQMVALKNLLEFGMITQAEYDAAVAEDVYSAIQEVVSQITEADSIHSYFVDQVVSELIADLQEKYGYTKSEANMLVYNGGLTIKTTMDPDIQSLVDEVYYSGSFFSESDYSIEITYIVTTENGITGKQSNYERTDTLSSSDDIDAYIQSVQDDILGTNDTVVADRYYYAPQPQSAMVILDHHTGHVVALAGGRGEKQTNRSFSRATNAVRQPGSAFKIVASYAPALDMGLITPATVFDDSPLTIGDWSPKNSYSGFRGLNTVRESIISSINIVAIKNMQETGIENAYNYLQRFGFESLVDDDKNLSTALGGITNGVSTLEMASAYGAIANGGYRNAPVFYTEVLDHDGIVILENITEPTQVISKTTAYLLTDMMKDVITSGTGGKASLSVNMAVAGKTGTTSDYKDLYFAGFTPYYTCGVWLGHDTPKAIGSATRSDGTHMRMWSYIMSTIHSELEYKDFDKPDGIVTASICKESGLLAVSGLCDHDPRGSMVRSEMFAAGTAPTEYCDVHMEYEICAESGAIPNEYCSDEGVATVIGIIREGAENSGTGDAEYAVPQSVLSGIICTAHNLWNQGISLPGESEDQLIDDENGGGATDDPSATPSSVYEMFPLLYPELNPISSPTPTPTPVPPAVSGSSDRPLITD